MAIQQASKVYELIKAKPGRSKIMHFLKKCKPDVFSSLQGTR